MIKNLKSLKNIKLTTRKVMIWLVIFIGSFKFLCFLTFRATPLLKTYPYQFSALSFAFSYPPLVGKDAFWAKKNWIKFGDDEFHELSPKVYDQINHYHLLKLQYLAAFAYLLYRPGLQALGYESLIDHFTKKIYCPPNEVARILKIPRGYKEVTLAEGFNLQDARRLTFRCGI